MTTDKKNPLPTDDSKKESTGKKSVIDAHRQADTDIDKDPDMDLPTPNDDLDEGELANLGGDKNDLI